MVNRVGLLAGTTTTLGASIALVCATMFGTPAQAQQPAPAAKPNILVIAEAHRFVQGGYPGSDGRSTSA
jgi:hypothetical protein